MKYLFFITLLMTCISGYSQNKNLLYLWPGKVPGETKDKQEPVAAPSKNDNVLRYAEITNPALEIFLAAGTAKSNPAVIVCPGGGYSVLAYDKEGTEIAAWLNRQGISAFVLQYRVPQKKEGALQDIQRSIRLVKSNSEKWAIDPDRLGIIGFSAGGSLCARAATTFNKKTYSPIDLSDSISSRPSFAMLIYPAYLDQGPDFSLTPELTMSREVPPMFIFQTADDNLSNSSLVMAGALRKMKIPVELHLLPKGGHGYGMRPGNVAAETWPGLAEKWLKGVL